MARIEAIKSLVGKPADFLGGSSLRPAQAFSVSVRAKYGEWRRQAVDGDNGCAHAAPTVAARWRADGGADRARWADGRVSGLSSGVDTGA